MSLVTRIFALIAFTLLLVAGGELINGLTLRQNRLAEVRGDTTRLARIAELDMVRILEGTHQLLATLAKLPVGHGWDERACAVVQATVMQPASAIVRNSKPSSASASSPR